MRSNQEQLRLTAYTARQAFTLVELLAVSAIIVLLAALTLIVTRSAIASAKVAKTYATIQKLDTAIQQIFETYEDKFTVIKRRVAGDYPALPAEQRQKIALHFIRDLMRMEMPQNWAETRREPYRLPHEKPDTDRRSPLLDYYQTAYQEVLAATQDVPHRSALLFLIIQNLNPEALEAFHGSEVADTDGDGLLEFVDAWGNPIRFLRWAPELTDSDLQKAVKNDPDPFDERKDAPPGGFLYPLIYSAGPDGKPGIEEGDDLPTVNEGVLTPFPYGKPDGTKRHFDNIHNHQWYRSF